MQLHVTRDQCDLDSNPLVGDLGLGLGDQHNLLGLRLGLGLGLGDQHNLGDIQRIGELI